ncbi:uncharacterized protein CBL_01909 [Carabus blaptoides fortunei]
MKHFIVSACLLGLSVCAFASPEGRVTGGDVAKEGQHAVEDLAILAGTLNRTSGGIRYQVERAIMHDKVWDADNFGNDIGLIKVAEEIEFTANIQPVGLHLEHIEPDMWLTLCGWGRTHEEGHSVEDLHYIDLKIIDRKTCQSMHKHKIKNYMMCTLTKKGEGSCKGDSGSPLLLDGRIAGISSWGKKCGYGNPNVYTRVEYFIDWVYKTLEENS